MLAIACTAAVIGADAAAAEPTIVAAGQIASAGRGNARTARLVQTLHPTTVLALGDAAAPHGTARDFAAHYRPTWGRFKGRTRPVPGDREYRTRGASGYFRYFGAAAGSPGRGYYSFDLGGWHLVALNSNCRRVGCGLGSAQERWLRADLAAHPADCTLAYWHHPRFTSGRPHRGAPDVEALWQALHDAHADVVLNAHNPSYERFGPQDPRGRADPSGGLREFVVGTGGQRLSAFGRRRPNSEVRRSHAHGVLELGLARGRYSWRFVTTARGAVADRGAAPCHGRRPGGPPTGTAGPAGTPSPSPLPSDPVLTIAGDIAGGDAGEHDEATARLVESIDPAVAAAAGDNAYVDGTLAEYLQPGGYNDTWGRFKAKTRPVPGNHEYHTTGAAGYFDYFNGVGEQTGLAGERGKGYYSYDLGAWHIVALNSNIAMSAGSAQEQWLRADLAAHPGCTMAYWHHPRFTSGAEHANDTDTQPLWQALYDNGADVVVNGHNHQYERFGPQSPTGQPDPFNGIREFVSGAGGAGLYGFGSIAPNSEVRNALAHGVLKLTLHADRYDWQFVPIPGDTFTDAGSAKCHTGTPPTATRSSR